MSDKRIEREELAAFCHNEQWSDWMKYLFSKCVKEEFGLLIPNSWVEHWNRQINTPYKDLSEREKNSDRKEADAILKILHASEQARIKPVLDVYERYKNYGDAYPKFGEMNFRWRKDMWQAIKSLAESVAEDRKG